MTGQRYNKPLVPKGCMVAPFYKNIYSTPNGRSSHFVGIACHPDLRSAEYGMRVTWMTPAYRIKVTPKP